MEKFLESALKAAKVNELQRRRSVSLDEGSSILWQAVKFKIDLVTSYGKTSQHKAYSRPQSSSTLSICCQGVY